MDGHNDTPLPPATTIDYIWSMVKCWVIETKVTTLVDQFDHDQKK